MTSINIFLKLKLKNLGDVKGEVPAGDHKDEILIERYHWSESIEAAPAAGAGKGKTGVKVHDFEFWMKMSQASPLIMLAVFQVDPVIEAVLTSRNSDAKMSQDFLKYTLSDGVIATYETEASQDRMIPMDRFTIRFRKLSVEFKPVSSDGRLGSTVSTSFDAGTAAPSGS